MTISWDSLGAVGRLRRFRGGEIPPSHPTPWREQQRQARHAFQAARAGARRDPAADRSSTSFRLGFLRVDGDAVFAFLLFLPMLFLVQLATVGAAMIAGLTPLYLFVRRRQLGQVLLPRLFLYALPALALCSVAWSEAPKESLKYALELAITVTAGLLLSSAGDPGAVLRAIALAFLIYVIDAILVGGQVLVGGGLGGQAFSGLTASKNLMADIASTGLIVSLAVVILSLAQRKWVWAAACCAAVAMDLYVVLAARSAGAMLGLALGLAPLLTLIPLMYAGKAARAWLTTMLVIVLAVAGVFYRSLTQALIDLGANVFDKDPTLTGRTYLWYRAADLIHEKPILGRGYFAFWLQGNTDAEGLWRYAGIVDRGGFNFHNTLVEILVTLGWAGAAAVFATVLIGAVALIRAFVQRPSLALVFWISMFLYVVARTPIETLGIQPFYFTTVLVFGALGAAFGRGARTQAAAEQRFRMARQVQVRPVDYVGEAWANPRMAPVRGSLRLLRSNGGDRR